MNTHHVRKSMSKKTEPTLAHRLEKLARNRLADESFGWRTFEATVPTDTPIEQLLASDFWKLNAHRLQRGDHIRWRDDSLTRFGELVVIAADVETRQIQPRSVWQGPKSQVRRPSEPSFAKKHLNRMRGDVKS